MSSRDGETLNVAALAQAMAVLEVVDAGEAAAAADEDERVLPSEIAAFVAGEELQREAAVVAALGRDLRWRRLYEALKQRQQVAEGVTQVAAASVEARSELRLSEALLRWQSVLSGGERVLLQLEFGGDASPHEGRKPVLHLQWGDEFRRVRFSEVVHGTAQCVLAASDPALLRIQDDAERSDLLGHYSVVL